MGLGAVRRQTAWSHMGHLVEIHYATLRVNDLRTYGLVWNVHIHRDTCSTWILKS